MYQRTTKRLFLLASILSFGQHLSTHAQTLIGNNYGMPSIPLQVNSAPQAFKIKIAGGATACANSNLKISIPEGFEFSASQSPMINTGTGTIAFQSAPSSLIRQYTVNNIPAAPDSTVITYYANASCQAYLNGLARFNYELLGCNNSYVSAETTVQSPQLNLANISRDNFIGNIGDTFHRHITITNGGFGYADTLSVRAEHSQKQRVIAASSNTGTLTLTPYGNTYHYRVSAPTNNGQLNTGESIIITEVVELTCSGVTSANYTVYPGTQWGSCYNLNNTNASIFKKSGTTAEASGKLELHKIKHANLSCLPTTNDNGWTIFKLKNNSDQTTNVTDWRVFNTNASCAYCNDVYPYNEDSAAKCARRSAYIDTAAGVFQSADGGLTWQPKPYTVASRWVAPGHNTNKPVWLNLTPGMSPLATNDSIYIRVKLHDEIPTCCGSEWKRSDLDAYATFTTPCSTYGYVGVNEASLTNYTEQYTMSNISAPEAFIDQDYFVKFKGIIHLGSTDTNYYKPDGYLQYTLDLPSSLNPSANASDFTLSKTGVVIPVDSYSWDTSLRRLTLTFNRSSINNFDKDLWTLTVKSTPNCTGIGNEVILNGFVKSAACNTTAWNAICNVSAPFTVRNCTNTCEGALNYATTVTRQNYGIYSAGNDGFPSGSMNPANLNLSKTIYGDTLQVAANAKVLGSNSYSHAHYSITKSENDTTHTFISSTAYIYNVAGLLLHTLPNLGQGNLTVDLPRKSTRVISINGASSPTSFQAGDSIVVVTNYRQKLNSEREVHFTTSIYTSNSANASDTPTFHCNANWTATVDNYAYGVQHDSTHAILTSACDTSSSKNIFKYYLGQFDLNTSKHSLFPNEIRNIFTFERLEIIKPANFSITNLSLKVKGQGLSNELTLITYNP